MGGVSSPDAAVNRKPQTLLSRALNVALALVLVLVGPVMMGVGSRMADADDEIARTGVHTTGIIVDFKDARRASQRDIRVRYMSADGTVRYTSANVDHDQHPKDGEEVTVAYREQEPGQAVVLGYESDGIMVRGIGTILAMIFVPIVLILVFSKRGKRRRDRRG
jgi:hypothetical protein